MLPFPSKQRCSSSRGKHACSFALFSLTFAGLLPVATVASAETASLSGLEAVGAKLSDEALAEMRGKFITPEAISYFGIQMTTSWQGADGITTTANLLFNVGFTNGAGGSGTPQLLISWTREGDPSLDVASFGESAQGGYVALIGSNGLVPVSSLNGVDGVFQSNVIAGADNQSRNAMTIAVVPVALVAQQQPSGMQEVSGSVTQGFSDGDRIDFIVGAPGVGLGLTSGQGADSVRQGVDSVLGRIAQETVLNSNNNDVMNVTSVVIGVDTTRQLDTIRVDQAISAMKMNGF